MSDSEACSLGLVLARTCQILDQTSSDSANMTMTEFKVFTLMNYPTPQRTAIRSEPEIHQHWAKGASSSSVDSSRLI